MKYQVIDRQTNQKIGKPYSTRTRANNKADKLDMEYGAIRYVVRTTNLIICPLCGVTYEYGSSTHQHN